MVNFRSKNLVEYKGLLIPKVLTDRLGNDQHYPFATWEQLAEDIFKASDLFCKQPFNVKNNLKAKEYEKTERDIIDEENYRKCL
jgi:hypothetical protein